jgi:ClpP class serine protease
VISAGFGLVDAIGRLGVERRLHATGPQKGLLDPFQPERAPDLEVLREIQAGILDEFLAQVRARRGERLKVAPPELTSGRVWTGRRAVELGLADGLGQAHAVLRDRFGESLRIRRIESRRSFWRARLGLDGSDVVGEVATGLDDRAARQRLGAGG